MQKRSYYPISPVYFFKGAGALLLNNYVHLLPLQNTASSMVPNSYEIDETNKWGWITLYVVTIVIAILGNLLFIVSCLCTKRTRTTGYYLLINLSIRDILVAALCVPFTLDTEVINYKSP